MWTIHHVRLPNKKEILYELEVVEWGLRVLKEGWQVMVEAEAMLREQKQEHSFANLCISIHLVPGTLAAV